MKPFTDHFSLARKTISFCLIVAFAFTNVVALETLGMTSSNESALATFTTDLTQLGRQGRLRQSPSFETEVNKVLAMLEKGGGRQPVIVDENGSVQDEIVEQIALRIAKGTVAESMRTKSLIKLETTSLFSNSVSSAQLNAAVSLILEPVLSSQGETILFVEDMPAFVNVATQRSLFVSAIRDGKVRLIGGSSEAAYKEKVAVSQDLANLFDVVRVGRSKSAASKDTADRDAGFVGDNVSPDLRQMMADDPSGNRRVDVILQARDADNASLRALLSSGTARIANRIGNSDSLVVNMPLSAIQSLSTSGLINYVSPDRTTGSSGHIETTTGAAQMRNQPTDASRPAYYLEGTGVGIAFLDSGIFAHHNAFKGDAGSSRIVANVNFTSSNTTEDRYGHGTHVAALAAGNEGRRNGAYRGIAPDADIISVKVFQRNMNFCSPFRF
jgi:hypothetical protein